MAVDEKWADSALKIFRIIVTVVLAGVVVLILLAAMKFFMLHSIFGYFVNKTHAALGVDARWANFWGVILTIAAVLVLPTLASFLLFGKRKQDFLIACVVIFVVWGGALFYITNNPSNFDRITGKAAAYYIKTMNGFKTSSAPDYDGESGQQYRPITPDVANEIQIWKASGSMSIPKVEKGQYFNKFTGEPIVFYIINSDNKVVLEPLPGFHTATGEKLQPVTKEIIRRYDAEQAAALAEQERKAKEAKTAEEKKAAEQHRRELERQKNELRRRNQQKAEKALLLERERQDRQAKKEEAERDRLAALEYRQKGFKTRLQAEIHARMEANRARREEKRRAREALEEARRLDKAARLQEDSGGMSDRVENSRISNDSEQRLRDVRQRGDNDESSSSQVLVH